MESLLGITKICRSCNLDKNIQDFPADKNRKDGYYVYCKECSRQHNRASYLKHRTKRMETSKRKYKTNKVYRENQINKSIEIRKINCSKILEYLSEHPCVDCGERDPIVLEFDHIQGKKKSNISTMVHSNTPWYKIQEEIMKCEIRCANCHRRKTFKNSYKGKK